MPLPPLYVYLHQLDVMSNRAKVRMCMGTHLLPAALLSSEDSVNPGHQLLTNIALSLADICTDWMSHNGE
jgi:hypothetical protein